MNKKRIIYCALCFICISCSFAGPFGLEMGMSLAQVKESCGGRDPVPVADDRYQIVPQKVHPSFVVYIAWINKTEGLYYLKAISEAVTTSSYGIELKNEFTRIKDSLDKNYGQDSTIDALLPGSIWNDAGDWMSGLVHKERYLFTTWNKDSGATLPDSITAILLQASADDTSTGSIQLEYEFANNSKAEERLKNVQDSVL
ncbi:MAG: hypothetical protein M0P01_08720 [Treponema sp.]|nr:hypothetical protein [Treponema sp.]